MKNNNIKSIMLILAFLVLIKGISFAQETYTVTGKVTDTAGNPVEKVIVSVLDEFTQVQTDKTGEFKMIIEANKTILFSKFGYKQQTLTPAKGIPVQIQLQKEKEEQEFQVAYGTRNRSELTSSISAVLSSDLEKVPVSTLGNAVQGYGSGLTVLHTTGAEPGWDSPSIYIRGTQTFGGGYTPLVFVDNVERDFTQLDPEEIESFTILKDAAATAMYGMRGGNGVILVTTKKGYVGKPVISLTAQYGLQSSARLPEYVEAADYVHYKNIALRNDYSKLSDNEFNELFLSNPKNNPDNYDGSNPYLYANTDWYNSFLKSYAPQQSYKLSFRGGTEVAQYYILLGVMEQEGLYKYTEENAGFSTQNKFSRYNFRSSIDVNLTDNIKIGVNLGGRVENRHIPNSGASSIISSLSKNPATMPIFNADSSIAGTSIYTNAYGLIAKTGFQDRFARYVEGTATLDWKLDKILKGLSANALFGFDVSKQYGRSKNQSFARYQQNLDGSYTQYGESSSIDLTFSGWDDTFDLMMNYLFGFSYNRTFGVDHIAADIKYMQSSESVVGDNPDYRNQGIFGRATYSHNGKYTTELGFAYNGSENFVKGNRFGFFPTISGAWVVSKEDFWADNDVISYLKLRGSFGKTGNSNIGISDRYPYEEKFNSGNGYYFGTATSDGSYEGRIPNGAITWEEALCANLGVEIELHKALQLDLDIFRNDRNQIITGRWNTLPSYIGQDLPYENNGSVLTRGFELTAVHRNSAGKFNYFIKGTVSYAQNTVTAMDEVAGLNQWEYKTNRAVMQQWGLEVANDKFFKDQSDIDGWAKSSYGTVQPGDVKYVDQNSDNIIDSQDQIPLGKPSVPEWNFGLNLGCEFKGFDFNILVTGIANRSMFVSNNVLWGMQDNNNITYEVANNSWGISNNPLYPRLTTQLNNHNYQASSLWLKSGNYVKVQTLEIGYSLPKRLISKANITEARFFINGYNLFSFDRMKKYNLSAEAPNAGVTMYPEIKVTSMGVSLNF
ncbi:MAG TPA: TonB-dependent receptor [Prolixibacteraceae bacterium]|nr:TonB-dependent receptor [Prolixibacteraceae bacterium]